MLKNPIFVKELEPFRFFSYSREKVLTLAEDICTLINILLNVLVIIIKSAFLSSLDLLYI